MHVDAEAPKVSIQELADISQQFADVLQGIADGQLVARDVRQALQAIIGTSALPAEVLARDRFTPPQAQVENLRRWSQLIDSAWMSDQFDRLVTDIPTFDDEELLIPLTLCWTLNTLASTIDAKIQVMRHVYGRDRVVVTSKFNPDSKHTRIVNGGPKFEGNRLWWQLIDLGANRFKAPNQIPAETAAGCEVFDVICQHPIYVGQQDGSETPFLDVPGLSVKVRGVSGSETPDAVGGPTGGVAVHVNWEGSVYPDHAEPVREES